MTIRIGRASLPLAALTLLSLSACGVLGSEEPQGDAAASAAATEAVPAAQAAAKSEGALKASPPDEILTLISSDPKATISGVFLDGQPLTTEGLGTTRVRALMKGDPEEGGAIECRSYGLELRLANGVLAKPLDNLCERKWTLRVDGTRTARPATLPAVPEGFAWTRADIDGEASLFFGIPETDATTVLATCNRGSGRVQTRFFSQLTKPTQLELLGPDRMLRYGLDNTSDGGDEAPPTHEADLSVDDPLWKLLRTPGRYPYRLAGDPFATLDTAAGTETINRFLGDCAT